MRYLFILLYIALTSCVDRPVVEKEEIIINPLDTFRKEREMTIRQGSQDNGRDIFRKNCAVCHAFNLDLAGPKITNRITYNKMFLIIKDLDSLVAAKDPYSMLLVAEWDKKCGRMHQFGQYLTDDEIDQVVYYIYNNLNH